VEGRLGPGGPEHTAPEWRILYRTKETERLPPDAVSKAVSIRGSRSTCLPICDGPACNFATLIRCFATGVSSFLEGTLSIYTKRDYLDFILK